MISFSEIIAKVYADPLLSGVIANFITIGLVAILKKPLGIKLRISIEVAGKDEDSEKK